VSYIFLIKRFFLTTLLLISINSFSPLIHATHFINAGPPVVNLEHIGQESLSGINLIMQDSQGFIWLVKKEGLFRYDSKELIQFPGHQQFSMDKVSAIVEGRPGHLWIATKANGLAHFNTWTSQLTYHHLQQQFKVPTPTNEVDLLTYHEGVLYLAIKSHLLLIDEQRLTVKQRISLPIDDSDFVVSLMVDSTASIWFSSLGTNGLFVLKDNDVRQFKHQASDPTSIGSTYVPTVFEDSKGRIWVGTIKGLALYQPRNGSFLNLQPFDMSLPKNQNLGAYANVLTSIVEDPTGALWLGLFHGGLFKFDPDSRVFEHFPKQQGLYSTVLDNSIDGGLFMDNQQTLWVLNRKSISQLDINNRKFNQWFNVIPDSNDSCTPFNIHQFKDNFYFSCFNTLNTIDDNKATELFKIKDKIRSVSHTADNLVWLGTMGGGVYRYDLATHQSKQYLFASLDTTYANSVKQLRPDLNDVLYGITNAHPHVKGSGIIRYDGASDSFEQFSTGLELIDFVDIDAHKMLLITSYTHYEQALYWFDKQTQLSEQLPIVTGEIFAALRWQDSILLSTQKLGLITLDPNTGEIQPLETTLPATINGLYFDQSDQQLYLSTSAHLYRADKLSKGQIATACVTCNLNIQYQGINHLGAGQFVSSNSALINGGQFFISGKNLMLNFTLAHSLSDTTEQRLRLTGFKLLNQLVFAEPDSPESFLESPIGHTKKLTIPAGVNLFSFLFANVDFKNNQYIKYRYKLEGLNRHWIETDADNAEAVYSLLPPGQYQLKVKTSDHLGDWSQEQPVLSLDINVLPHWWQTWWAYTLYLLSVVSIISIIFWLYSRKKIAELAKDNAFELAQSKEDLFANLSHEFRTPLTLILGPANEIKRLSTDPKTQQNIDLIERNAQRLLSMVDQLLQLAQLKEQQTTSTGQQVVTVCQFAIQSFAIIARERGIDLKPAALIDDTWWVPGSQHALEIILSNLLTNAIKYTPSTGEVSLTVRQQSDWIEFTVSDTGCGIAQEHQSKIFERFTRLENNHNDAAGVGIGLALVKELISTLGGKITVSSQLNKGSNFVFRLPKVDAPTKRLNSIAGTASLDAQKYLTEQLTSQSTSATEPATQLPTLADSVNSDADGTQEKQTLLIVEDNDDMRRFITTRLEDDYHVLEACDGHQGFALACKQSPDIIISDVMMPNMDGFQLLNAIRNELTTSHIPVILLTAKNDQPSKLSGLTELADDYITKPFDSQELLLRIKNVLGIRAILQSRFDQASLQPELAASASTPATAAPSPTNNQTLSAKDQQFLSRFSGCLGEMYNEPQLGVADVADNLAMSARQLQRKLKAITGSSFSELLRNYRLTQSCLLLADGSQVAVVADRVGFSSSSYFVRCFKAQYDTTPNEYRKVGTLVE